MPRLPNSHQAVVAIGKLEDYCLSPVHPRGRHKARIFGEVLDIHHDDAAWLRNAILDGVQTAEAVELAADNYGTRWQADIAIKRQFKSGMIRTIWIIRAGENIPRFITSWVL